MSSGQSGSIASRFLSSFGYAAKRQFGGAMACAPMGRSNFLQYGKLNAAARLGVGTARMEGAAGRRISRIGDLASRRAGLVAKRRIGFRDRRQQRFGIGMAGSGVERGRRRG